jgi:hypothetical protein
MPVGSMNLLHWSYLPIIRTFYFRRGRNRQVREGWDLPHNSAFSQRM